MSDMQADVSPLFVRLPNEDARQLERAVAASGKSKRQLVSEAVREHLTDDGLVVGHAALRESGEEVMTAGETAALLKLDEHTVLAAAQGGELPARQIGGHWRFSRDAILAWLAGHAHPSDR
ncbi:MAG TPA: helix-turn-helix domain-containing protein [Solirubrobacteraceae bacterium]|nr:helix-turn-helix domain-containing protein [Solirubrobacteraceae bacterium]